MFAKSVAVFSLAAMVSGRVMVTNTTTSVTIPSMTPTPIYSTPSATPSGGPGPVGAMIGPCGQEGLWNCVDGASFQRCASGAWSVVQPMAPGTYCARGKSINFQILPAMPSMVPTPVQPMPTPSGTPSTGPVSGGPANLLAGPCKNEGLWNCIDGASFQRCASGVWSVSQTVAPGTKCTKGKSMDFQMHPMRPFMHARRRILV